MTTMMKTMKIFLVTLALLSFMTTQHVAVRAEDGYGGVCEALHSSEDTMAKLYWNLLGDCDAGAEVMLAAVRRRNTREMSPEQVEAIKVLVGDGGGGGRTEGGGCSEADNVFCCLSAACGGSVGCLDFLMLCLASIGDE